MILDECGIAEAILETNHLSKKDELFIVAKYLRREMKCDVLETYSILNTLMENSFSNYKSLDYFSYLENLAIKASEYELKQIENIDITKNELNKISQIDNAKQRRLLFTLLVYAKYNNALSENNNNWCNISIRDLYKIARVATRNTKEKALLLCKLSNQGVIDFSKQNINHNIRCLIVDDSKKDIEYVLTDLRELGYQYLQIYDKSQFSYCESCGKIIKRSNKNDFSTKYCNECKQTIKNQQNLNYFQKLDKANPQ